MNQIKLVPTNKIKPDPNQPRKIFDEQKIAEMAQSYIGQGIINPIEIDTKNMIITGECRWKAAKIARLEKVPCIVNEKKMTPIERKRRQCVENAHHSDMYVMDIAKAWKEQIDDYLVRSRHELKSQKGHATDIGHTWWAEEIGKTEGHIREVLSMLYEPKFVKDYLKNKQGGQTFFTAANKVPEKFRDKVKKLITDETITKRDDVRVIAKALKECPEKEKEIFETIKSSDDINYEIKAIIKNDSFEPKEEIMSPTEFGLKVDKLIISFEKHIKSIFPELSTQMKKRIIDNLKRMIIELEK